MSTPLERELAPGVHLADLRDAVELLDAYRAGDADRCGTILDRARHGRLILGLLGLLDEAVATIGRLSGEDAMTLLRADLARHMREG